MATTKNSPTKANRPPAKKGSPGKKTAFSPPAKKKGGMKISVHRFKDPISIECYIFQKSGNKDGYLHGLRKYVKNEFGNTKHEALENLGWLNVYLRRVPYSSNEVLRDSDDYMRSVIVRYPPDRISTPQTRKDCMEALKSFFADERFSNYPSHNIETIDETDEDHPEPLDKYFMDEQIKEFLIAEIPPEELNREFASTYNEFAPYCWSSDNVSQWAREILGFGG